MKHTSLALAAALSVFAFAAHADDADPAGQFANSVVPATAARTAGATRTQVQAEFAQYRKDGVNPWSTSYNPLASFKGEKTREQVRNEYLAQRAAVSAMTGEDSGSAYLAAHQGVSPAQAQFAGQPVNAQ